LIVGGFAYYAWQQYTMSYTKHAILERCYVDKWWRSEDTWYFKSKALSVPHGVTYDATAIFKVGENAKYVKLEVIVVHGRIEHPNYILIAAGKGSYYGSTHLDSGGVVEIYFNETTVTRIVFNGTDTKVIYWQWDLKGCNIMVIGKSDSDFTLAVRFLEVRP